MRFKKPLYYVLAAVLAVLIGLGIGYWTFGRQHQVTDSSALLLHPPKPLPAFGLEADTQSPFTLASLHGHWSFLYFGYTHCPDVCPTTLADLDKMSGQLADLPAASRPTVYFISVDPKRDTPGVLARYARYFNADFVGVSGAPDQLQLLTHALGVAFSYDPPDQSGNYSVEHSSVVFLINPEAEEAAVFTSPIIPLRMADDYRIILRQHGNR